MKDLGPGTGLRTDSFLLVAVGKEPEACETEDRGVTERGVRGDIGIVGAICGVWVRGPTTVQLDVVQVVQMTFLLQSLILGETSQQTQTWRVSVSLV